MTTCERFSSSAANYSGDLRRVEHNIITSRQGLVNIDKKKLLDLDSVFKLRKSRCYSQIMQKVEDALILESCDEQLILSWKACVKLNEQDAKRLRIDWENFRVKNEELILDSYALLVEIENEIVSIHNFIRDTYTVEVGELELIVEDPIEYARVVKRIGNDLDLAALVADSEGVLPSAIIMVFSCWQIEKTIEACDRAIALDSAKKKLEDFIEGRMRVIAPNLCAFVESGVAAARIMSTAGGLDSLARLPQSNMNSLGAITRGYLEQSGIVHPVPRILLLGIETRTAGRLDSQGLYRTGLRGVRFRRSICLGIETYKNRLVA